MTCDPICQQFAAQYGVACLCDIVRAAYRRGYNDHARAQQHWQDTHGAYRPNLAQMRGSGQVSTDDGSRAVLFNQHGEGENP